MRRHRVPVPGITDSPVAADPPAPVAAGAHVRLVGSPPGLFRTACSVSSRANTPQGVNGATAGNPAATASPVAAGPEDSPAAARERLGTPPAAAGDPEEDEEAAREWLDMQAASAGHIWIKRFPTGRDW